MPASVGALLPRMELVRRAHETGARIVVPTGALLGLDAVRAAAEGPIDSVTIEPDDYFATFKIYRKSFERIASQKYDKGHVEVDGTVCIRAMDVPHASVN